MALLFLSVVKSYGSDEGLQHKVWLTCVFRKLY